MLNFGLKHRHSSGWHKKFPRQKVEREDPMHLGMHEHLRFRNEYMEGRQGYLSRKEIDNFLEANLGKNVDKVFSEFCKRAKRHKHDESLRQAFYGELDPERRWKWRHGGLYTLDAQNKIIRVVRKEIKNGIDAKYAYTYNAAVYPYNITQYLRETEVTYIGNFYIRTRKWEWALTPVYVCNKEWYSTLLELGIGKKYVKISNMNRVVINFSKDTARGVKKNGYSFKDVYTGKKTHTSFGDVEIPKRVRIPYSTTDYDSDYIFLAKGDGWSSY